MWLKNCRCVDEPMLSRPATLRDPGTPDQIAVGQHTSTHFPSQPWCKECVESRGRDSPYRELLNIDAVVPQLKFDDGYMGDGDALQIACFLVGTDTSSGAIFSNSGAGLQEDGDDIHGCWNIQVGTRFGVRTFLSSR